MGGHAPSPSLGDASSLFGSSDTFEIGDSTSQSRAGVSLSNPFEGIAEEELEFTESTQETRFDSQPFSNLALPNNSYETPTMATQPYFGDLKSPALSPFGNSSQGSYYPSPASSSGMKSPLPSGMIATPPTERPTSALTKRQVNAYDPPTLSKPPSTIKRSATGYMSPYLSNGTQSPNLQANYGFNNGQLSPGLPPSVNRMASPPPLQNKPPLPKQQSSFPKANLQSPNAVVERPTSAQSQRKVNAYDPPVANAMNRRPSAYAVPANAPGRMSPFNPAAQAQSHSRPSSPFSTLQRGPSPAPPMPSLQSLMNENRQSQYLPNGNVSSRPPSRPGSVPLPSGPPPIMPHRQTASPYQDPVSAPAVQPNYAYNTQQTNGVSDPELARIGSNEYTFEDYDQDAALANESHISRHATTSSRSSVGTAGAISSSPDSRRGSYSLSPLNSPEQEINNPYQLNPSAVSSFPPQASLGVGENSHRPSMVAEQLNRPPLDGGWSRASQETLNSAYDALPQTHFGSQPSFPAVQPTLTPARPIQANGNAQYLSTSPARATLASSPSRAAAYGPAPVNTQPSASSYAPKPLGSQEAQALRQPYPLAVFAPGGRFLTAFPRSNSSQNSAYGTSPYANGTATSQSTVTIHKLSHLVPEIGLDMFPGPLYSGPKSITAKLKKDMGAWLETRITEYEKEIIYVSGRVTDADQLRRANDRQILLTAIKALIESDGKIAGIPKAESAVKQLLVPTHSQDSQAGQFKSAIDLTSNKTSSMNSPVVSQLVVREADLEELRKHLLSGDRQSALRYSCENQLWPYALILASSMDTQAWKDVVIEFLDRDFGSATGGPNSDSLKLMYGMMGGLGASSVDCLLPKQSLATTQHLVLPTLEANGPPSRAPSPSLPVKYTKLAEEKLACWRDSAAGMMHLKCNGDTTALTALADLLASNAWYEAAHVCLLLTSAPVLSHFVSRVSLVGGPQPGSQPGPFDIESVMLSELIEAAVAQIPVSKGQEPFVGLPVIQAYKLHEAYLLAEYGQAGKSLKYCDAIESTLKLAKQRSPLYNSTLLTGLQNLHDRLAEKGSKADTSSSWMSRKTKGVALDSLWGSLEDRFTSFVAGEASAEATSQNAPVEHSKSAAAGPFAHYSSITPANSSGPPSRAASAADLHEFSASPYQVPAVSQPFQQSVMRPPMPSQVTAPAALQRKGHAHKRSQSLGFLAFGADPYASAPSWAPPPGAGTQEDPNEEAEQLADTAAASEPPQRVAASSWWDNTSASTSVPLYPSDSDQIAHDEDTAGFVSMMGNSSHERTANVSYSSELDIEDDLGFGNSKPKPQHRIGQHSNPDEAVNESHEKTHDTLEAPKPADNAATLKNSTSFAFLGRLFRKDASASSPVPAGPVKANLGEETSFVYDPELKRWVNKKAGQSNDASPVLQAAPPRANTTSPDPRQHMSAPTSMSSSPAMGSAGPPPPSRPASAQALGSGPPPSGALEGQRRATSAAAGKKNARSRYIEIS